MNLTGTSDRYVDFFGGTRTGAIYARKTCSRNLAFSAPGASLETLMRVGVREQHSKK